jgi:hypothetical protein
VAYKTSCFCDEVRIVDVFVMFLKLCYIIVFDEFVIRFLTMFTFMFDEFYNLLTIVYIVVLTHFN